MSDAAADAFAERLSPPPFPLPFLEAGRALSEMATLPAAELLLRFAPSGDGHPVIVCPGWLTSDRSTSLLRRFLKGKGYNVQGWNLGRNWGPGAAGPNGEYLADELIALYRRTRRKVSLVGWSLGGVIARELAKRAPDQVRQVMTLGSPLTAQPQSTSVHWLYKRIGDTKLEDAETQRILADIRRPPAHVPSTAIYTKTDGIVPWRASIEPEAPNTDNIEVHASHCGLGVNPLVFFAIADRLALPEGGWKPFDRTASRWRRIAFPSSGH